MSMGQTLRILNEMVSSGVIGGYAIAGAVAALNYIEPTVTEDLDVFVAFDRVSESGLVTLGPIVEYLAAKGYTEWRNEGLLIEGWPVQFQPVSDALDREAIERAETIRDTFGTAAPIPTRILAPEHIVGTALRTGRHKDHLRIDAFLEQGAVNLKHLAGVLERHNLDAAWRQFCLKTGRADPLAASSGP